MRTMPRLAAMTLTAAVAMAANAAAPDLTVTVDGVRAGKPIPQEQALCTPTADGKSDKVKQILRPTIGWSGAPAGTASFAVFMMDPDVPADFTDAGKEGKTLPKDSKRQDFFHYGIVNIPASATQLAGGDATKAPAAGSELPNDLGANGYVKPTHAYGGPCPPWNDERRHNYHFIVLALDADAPKTKPRETAKDAFNRLIGSKHVLAKGATIGTYTLNPALK